jgi:hypothetical protein
MEHRKRHKLARFTDNNQTIKQLPGIPRKTTTGRKRRTDTMLSKSSGSFTLQPTSMTNLRPNSMSSGEIYADGNSDPLPRRKHLSVSILIPPALPPPRPTVSHSKPLITVQQQPSISLTSHKICTEV